MQSWQQAIADLKILGEEAAFWGAVVVGLVLKFLWSVPVSWRILVGGALAGAAAAFYGTDFVIGKINGLTDADRNLVAIGLVLTGEHLVRWIINLSPEKAIAMWRGKKTGV